MALNTNFLKRAIFTLCSNVKVLKLPVLVFL
jgi:hypothetical protein